MKGIFFFFRPEWALKGIRIRTPITKKMTLFTLVLQ